MLVFAADVWTNVVVFVSGPAVLLCVIVVVFAVVWETPLGLRSLLSYDCPRLRKRLFRKAT